MKGIGHKIRAARFTRGKEWTQKKLADAAGLSQGYISAIERGDEFPSLKALKRIGEVLDCSLGYFIEEENELGSPLTESKFARRSNQDDTFESVKSNIAAIFKEMLQDQHANNKNNHLIQMQEDIIVLKKKVATLETNLKKKR